jgi:selenocysteine lyase/cysteine desulfurase
MDDRVATFAVTGSGLSPAATAERLGERGFAVWSGDYYAVEIMQRLGLDDGAVRVGILHYNTEDEVGRLLEALDSL